MLITATAPPPTGSEQTDMEIAIATNTAPLKRYLHLTAVNLWKRGETWRAVPNLVSAAEGWLTETHQESLQLTKRRFRRRCSSVRQSVGLRVEQACSRSPVVSDVVSPQLKLFFLAAAPSETAGASAPVV